MTARQHVVIGMGPIGRALAARLVELGDRVRMISRSPGVVPLGVEHVVLDARDRSALAVAARSADTIYNCANPGPYPVWEERWPPLATAILGAAEDSGAVLVTFSNLYGYGPVEGPISRDLPLAATEHKGVLRKRMWEQALASHRAGRVRATEARASDYLGPTASAVNGLLPRYAEKTLSGRSAWVLTSPDQPHSWTAVDDIAATLAVLGADERAWGEAWHVPTNAPATVRDVLRELGDRAGAPPPHLRVVPRWLLRVGTVLPLVREVKGVLYQFDSPFVIDASATTATFGIRPGDWTELLDATATAWAQRSR